MPSVSEGSLPKINLKYPLSLLLNDTTVQQPNGITDLRALIANMEPVLQAGEYVFTSVPDIEAVPRAMTICEMVEEKGTTVVLAKADAERLGLSFAYVAAWITLNVHSALEAVGLTAAFATGLGEHGISCNVIAGFYHDHIFVDYGDRERAVEVLEGLARSARVGDTF